MQQRRLRLGDILDDYCPRERRITNHVVVAMIDEDVKQTRCTTCDAEHEFKQAKVPAPRRKKTGALHDIPDGARPRAVVPAPVHDPLLETPADDFEIDADADAEIEVAAAAEPEHVEDPLPASGDADADADTDAMGDESDREDDGFVHRRLIRATLPRPEGHVPERKEPEFTVHHQGGRDFNGNRSGQRRHRGARQAHGQQGGQNRFGGERQGAGAPRHGSGAPHGQGQGQGGQRQGNRQGQPDNRGGGRPGGQNRGGGRKRGR